jgi:predicted Zn-ribbon and HTH transcriptional regulator
MSPTVPLTIPQRLRQALTGPTPKSSKDLSTELSLSERELGPALEKLQRSLQREGLKLRIEAARCVACSFEFEARSRVAKPSRCPSCRSERIVPPRFWIESGD